MRLTKARFKALPVPGSELRQFRNRLVGGIGR